MDRMTAKKFSNKARPKRPTVEAEIDDVEWGIFLDKWRIYKAIAELEDHEICMELRETCSTAVYKLLYQFLGSNELNRADITEIDMLAHIKGVAVNLFTRKSTDGIIIKCHRKVMRRFPNMLDA